MEHYNKHASLQGVAKSLSAFAARAKSQAKHIPGNITGSRVKGLKTELRGYAQGSPMAIATRNELDRARTARAVTRGVLGTGLAAGGAGYIAGSGRSKSAGAGGNMYDIEDTEFMKEALSGAGAMAKLRRAAHVLKSQGMAYGAKARRAGSRATGRAKVKARQYGQNLSGKRVKELERIQAAGGKVDQQKVVSARKARNMARALTAAGVLGTGAAGGGTYLALRKKEAGFGDVLRGAKSVGSKAKSKMKSFLAGIRGGKGKPHGPSNELARGRRTELAVIEAEPGFFSKHKKKLLVAGGALGAAGAAGGAYHRYKEKKAEAAYMSLAEGMRNHASEALTAHKAGGKKAKRQGDSSGVDPRLKAFKAGGASAKRQGE